MGAFPQFSFIYEEIKKKLDQRGGNNLPMSAGGVSGLTPWIRLISSAGNGLVLQSVYNTDGFTARYGHDEYKNSKGEVIKSRGGIVGYELDMKTPVIVTGRPLRPSPIINSVSIDEGDIGKRKTSFNIIAYSLEHMEKLAEYFLEPGFYVLLEWGWNTVDARSQWVGRDNGGVITPCAIAEHHKWKTIASKRRKSKHDYDATLGVITGGGIEFGENESYILKVELTSIGEVAEYMQTHKDAASKDNLNPKSGKIFNTREINEITKSDNNPAGRALFAQMVNGLPSAKQTAKIKNLQNHSNKIFVDQSSYVNMDEVIFESLFDNWRKGASASSESNESLKIPSDEPIISKERFIRFELAAEILQSYSAELEKGRKTKSRFNCPSNQQSLKININDCICGAFPHMFSTDKTKLFIPNIKAPAFGLKDAFSGESKKIGLLYNDENELITNNIHPNTVFGEYTGTRQKNGQYNGKKVPHAFPSNYELTKEDNPINNTDSTFVPYVAPLGWWGWLKNLYINFDFFTEVLQTPNYTVRDILYDLLNGMSGAVNSLWKFQIVETNVNNQTELKVVDLNFTGNINSVATDNQIKTFNARGTKSPFVSTSFTVDVPAATMNSVIQKRLSGKGKSDNVEVNLDVNPKPILGQVFSKKQDSVGTIISDIQFYDVSEEQQEPQNNNNNESNGPTEEEIRLANYEFFLDKAGVFPTIQYRTDRDDIIQGAFDWVSGNDANIEDVMMVGTWNDTTILEQLLILSKNKTTQLKNKMPLGELALNAPYGMARFEFTVHGLSGFKRGDVFRVDGIPKNFGKPHFFQVDSLSHNIDSSGWYVTVSAGLRPYSTNDNIDE